MNPKSFSIIGAGRAGRALAIALYKKGWICHSVISRRPSSVIELARWVGRPSASIEMRDLKPARWIFVCAPDDALPSLAETLAGVKISWKDVQVAHTSGSVESKVFGTLAARGAKACSIHPAISLSGAADDWQKISRATFAIEGDEAALAAARELLNELGAATITIPANRKAGYHLACVLASNYLVTLHAVALRIINDALGEQRPLQSLLVQLSQDTLHNLASQPPNLALTGPIARGDLSTVKTHLDFLKNNYPELLDLYKTLGRETLRCAPAAKLPAATVDEFKKLL